MSKVSCPTCKDDFCDERGMKIHHSLEHGESISTEKSECSVSGCSNTFEYYPSEKEGLICPKCVSSGKNYIHVDDYSTTNRVNKTTYIKTFCYQCSSPMIVTKTDHRERNFCSDECVNSFNSDRMKGENNPRYIDGNSRGKKYNSDWIKVKEKIMERDSNKCSICGCVENLHGHHIIPVREFVNEEDAHYKENAIILCASCHRNVEYGNKSIPDGKIEKDNLEVFDGEYI